MGSFSRTSLIGFDSRQMKAPKGMSFCATDLGRKLLFHITLAVLFCKTHFVKRQTRLS